MFVHTYLLVMFVHTNLLVMFVHTNLLVMFVHLPLSNVCLVHGRQNIGKGHVIDQV